MGHVLTFNKTKVRLFSVWENMSTFCVSLDKCVYVLNQTLKFSG